MDATVLEVLANPQTPALTVLTILVLAFLGFLRFIFKAIERMVEDVKEVAQEGTEVIRENSKIQGRMLEFLHGSQKNGRARAAMPAEEADGH